MRDILHIHEQPPIGDKGGVYFCQFRHGELDAGKSQPALLPVPPVISPGRYEGE